MKRTNAFVIESIMAWVTALLILLVHAPNCHAFVQSHCRNSHFVQTTTALRSGLFGDLSAGALSGLFGTKNQGPKTIIDIPARDVKIGALRFLLNIHLVGEQNKPEPKSWMTRQGDELGDLQVYYQDGTGMLSIQFQEYGIKMVRFGENPSLRYQLQESVLLHSILDELSNVAFGVADDGIEKEKRLLILQDDNAIDNARATLPAKKAS
jgi:hypothetical protein